MTTKQEDDDSFLQEFMARAKMRGAKLAQIQEPAMDCERADVTYPPLSPLPEGDETATTQETTTTRDDESNTDYRGENDSPNHHDLNYSSDLSLECDPNDVTYRAEPVMCNSSPEHPTQQRIQQHQYQQQPAYSHQASPRKNAPLAPLQDTQENLAASSQSLPTSLTDDQAIRDLKRKAERAEQTKNQLKKVVEISKYGSKEHIEAARLLQIADLEHLTSTNHVAMLEKGIKKKSESLGNIRISGLKIKIGNKLREDLAEDGVSHYFFCVASCGTEVKASSLIDTNDIRMQDSKTYLQFKEKISFDGLPPDFIVKMEVFELVVGQNLPRLLSRLTPSKKSRITPESNFKRVGSLRLSLDDRDSIYKNLVQWSDHEKSKYIERECKFHMELWPEQLPSKSGMLHVRCLDNHNCPDWSRYYVEMSSGQIRFWKFKQDCLDGKKPNQVIQFSDICSDAARRLECCDVLYRQHSFVLYSFQLLASGEGNNHLQRVLKDDNKYILVKHQFAAEDKEERASWCNLLDKSLNCFREWHGKTKIFTVDEAKKIFNE